MKKLKILILEDMDEDAGLVIHTLEKAGIVFDSEQVDNKEAFKTALRQFQPDVILSDHSLPQFNSTEALRICRLLKLPAPFILVTGTVSEEFAVISLKQGADDYVLKSNLSRLPSAVQHALNQRELQSRRLKTELELRVQNERLSKINQEMDNFIYSVSHNLRAPLMSVLGLINLTRLENPTFETIREYMDKINSSVLKLDETLMEILDYSRNARHEVECTGINLEPLIDASFDSLKYLDGFETVDKIVRVQQHSPLYSDAYRLRIVLNNILSNAINYRDLTKKDPHISIQATSDLQKASIIITDNGIGIGQENIDNIFTMFFRGSMRSDGAGLGLYIVKETISKLGGSINVSSRSGAGTQFSIELPNLISEKDHYSMGDPQLQTPNSHSYGATR